ncbi:MAG: phenylalanine--tRNA ligase subunit alpha [Candidatus Woesearchaeota archaeon]
MEQLIASLSPIEKTVIPYLSHARTVSELARKAGVQEIQALRACQFLSNKEAVELKQVTTEVAALTQRGEEVLAEGFPEEKFYDAISEKTNTVSQIINKTKLDTQEANISIGELKKQEAITFEKGIIKKTTKKPTFTHKELKEKKPTKELLKRGLIEIQTTTDHNITLTTKGKKLLTADLSKKYAETLTTEMLTTGSWKKQDFRRYDVTTRVPQATYGRRHFVQEAIKHIKQVWLEMGFTEMTGTNAQTAFWDLDALFVPQDHPAREEQDTFYLPHKGKLPDWYTDIQEVHETGGDTRSTGWQEPYSKEEAQKVLLRTHTTVLSAQILKQLKPEDLPAKYFSVAKVYRNETLDWKHLAEFHQVEGIIVGENLQLSDLIGLQKQFYKKMGYTDVRFRPAYFPYTEPSCEVEVYDPKKQEWLELGGMGVFRPEVVKPLLGIDVPVLAWGLGMERIITAYYEIKDLRDIYSNDLQRLREAPRYKEKK